MMYKHKCLACDRKEFKSQRSYTQHALWGHFSTVSYDAAGNPSSFVPSPKAQASMARRGIIRAQKRQSRSRKKASRSESPPQQCKAELPTLVTLDDTLSLEEDNARLRAIATFLFNQYVLKV